MLGEEVFSNYYIPNSSLSSQYRIHLSKSLNGPSAYNSTNHRLTHLLRGHLGCVNTLSWSTDGSLLLSGSDDQCLIIHKYIPGEQQADRKSFKLKTRFQTAHANNIFDAKFAPGNQEKIVSCAADGLVFVIDNWQHRSFDELNTRTLVASSSDDAKRLEFIDENNILIGCEDGHVVQFDLREEKPVKRIRIDLAELQVGIHSISKCPSAPHLLAIAGTDPFVRIFDLRGSLENAAFSWTPPLQLGKTANFATGVKFSRFGYSLAVNYIKDGPYLIDPIYQTESSSPEIFKEKIKAPDLEREMTQWRSFETAYTSGLFDLAEKYLRGLILQHKNLQNDSDWCEIMAHEVFNRVLCLGQSEDPISESETIKEDLLMVITVLDHWPARYLLIMYIFSLGLIEHGGIMCELFLRANLNVQNDWTRKLEQIRSIAVVCEMDPAQIPKLIPKNFSKACKEVSFSKITELEATKRIISKGFHGYLAKYRGVIHERTIKGVSFVGDMDQYIGVGSDGGYAFLYKTFTDLNHPIWAAKSDTSIVNVVEGHPFLPCIAVSGIDQTIKIWEPEILNSAKSEEQHDFEVFTTAEIPNLMQRLPTIQGINRLEALFDPFAMDPNALMFYLSSLAPRRL